MRVLKIIGGIDINVNVPEGSEITTVTLQEYLETEYDHQFEFIFCVHVLQTLWSSEVGPAINKLIKDLAHMGELHIYVPAAEQAAKAFIKGETDPALFYLFWGTKKEPHHSGFTLMWLRALLVQSGALVRRANLSRFTLNFEDQETNAVGHYLLATVLRKQ